jgi:hypothetical protein
MVDQIQVFDDMSEQARFTKIDDGSRTKSINIKLKKDKRKGDFGRATAGLEAIPVTKEIFHSITSGRPAYIISWIGKQHK